MREPLRDFHPLKPLVFHRLKIAYSWKCNASCAHCAVCSGPERREALDRSQVFACIDTAAELAMSAIEFTGGEIALFAADLAAFMTRAHERGLLTILNTNAFWARTPELARKRLTELRSYGLSKLIFSTDRYHQVFIPIDRVVNALAAARALGIPAAVTICSLADDSSLLDTIAALHPHTTEIKVQPVSPSGRAEELPRERMVRCSFAGAGSPCGGVHAPTVTPDGRVSLCCAPPMWLPAEVAEDSPLVLGWLDREPLREILARAGRNPFLALLAEEGLGAILERLNGVEPGFYRPRAEGYFGACDLCVEVLGSEPLLHRVIALLASQLPVQEETPWLPRARKKSNPTPRLSASF